MSYRALENSAKIFPKLIPYSSCAWVCFGDLGFTHDPERARGSVGQSVASGVCRARRHRFEPRPGH